MRGSLLWSLALVACGRPAPPPGPVLAQEGRPLAPEALAGWCQDPGEPTEAGAASILPQHLPVDSGAAAALAGRYTVLLHERDYPEWIGRNDLTLRAVKDTGSCCWGLRPPPHPFGSGTAQILLTAEGTLTFRFRQRVLRADPVLVTLRQNDPSLRMQVSLFLDAGWIMVFHTRDSLGLKGRWYWQDAAPDRAPKPGDVADGWFCAVRRGPAV